MDDVHHCKCTTSIEKRSAIASAVDVADDTASAGIASARADPTRYSWMTERLRITGGRRATSIHIAPPDGAERGAAQWLKTTYAECTRDG